MKPSCRAEAVPAVRMLRWRTRALLIPLLTLAGMAHAQSPESGLINPESMRERHFLLRFIGELEASNQLLEEAKQAAQMTPPKRTSFDYERLASDLHLMRSGIEDYLRRNGAPTPRSFAPLSGTYSNSDKP